MDQTFHVIEVGVDASYEHLIEQMRFMNQSRDNGVQHIGCIVRGYNDDSRELAAIPDVIELCKRLVRLGFISGLDVSTTFQPTNPVEFPGGLKPWGALEIWLLATGRMNANQTYEIDLATFKQFTEQLLELNARSDDLTGSS